MTRRRPVLRCLVFALGMPPKRCNKPFAFGLFDQKQQTFEQIQQTFDQIQLRIFSTFFGRFVITSAITATVMSRPMPAAIPIIATSFVDLNMVTIFSRWIRLCNCWPTRFEGLLIFVCRARVGEQELSFAGRSTVFHIVSLFLSIHLFLCQISPFQFELIRKEILRHLPL